MASLKLPNPEVTAMAAAISFGNEGKSYFTIGEVARITGKQVKGLAADLAAAGILATPSGKQGMGKKYSALDISEYMYQNRISPLRGLKGA